VSGIKVQIVDMSETFCDSLKALLPDTMTVDVCTDCENAFSRIVSYEPDILVIPSHLPGYDGLYLLQAVRSVGIHPTVLLVALLDISDRAGELKVDDIILRPCEMLAVANKVLALQDKVNCAVTPVREWIRNFLMSLGFKPNLCGYEYLFKTLELLSENPGQPLTKVIYPAVAKQINGSWEQIEHGIRLSVKDAWNRHNGKMWDTYFPGAKKRPSNSVFFTSAIQFLRRWQG